MHFNYNTLKQLLDDKVDLYNKPDFIENDPISIPRQFQQKEDIEIAAFLTATISWGNRKSIITNANKMMVLLNNAPYDFVINHTDNDLKNIKSFVHRTFNLDDFLTFIHCLKHLYVNENGLEGAFTTQNNLKNSLAHFPQTFLHGETPTRVKKHVANIKSGSAAKRINMFLRWMVRKDNHGVDFGIWTTIDPSSLFIPLDVHSGNTARKLNLLQRKQNDWKAVQELTQALRSFDPTDPIKYDFALFGMGVSNYEL